MNSLTNSGNVAHTAFRTGVFRSGDTKRGAGEISIICHQLSPGLRACEGSYGTVGNVQEPATLQRAFPYNFLSLSLFLSLCSRSEAK